MTALVSGLGRTGRHVGRHADRGTRSTLSVQTCPWWSEEVDSLY